MKKSPMYGGERGHWERGFLGFHKGTGLKTQVLGLAGGPVPLLLKREEW